MHTQTHKKKRKEKKKETKKKRAIEPIKKPINVKH